MTKKIALITGGSSGMGLSVATALSSTSTWSIHILDLNPPKSPIPNSTFHRTDVISYASLASAFQATFSESQRLDFVYANAGIVERDNFYEKRDGDEPPSEPNMLSIDINLKGVVNTSYLALHYMRRSKGRDEGRGPALVMTASCGGLYPSEFCPMYSASKAGVIHFNRAIKYCYHLDNIRTYVTAPGTIITGLLSSDEWTAFPSQFYTPMETLVNAVLMLVEGGDMTDSNGKKVEEKDAWGLTVEVNGDNVYFRDDTPFCDEKMGAMMRFTSMENQLARIEKGKAEVEERQDSVVVEP